MALIEGVGDEVTVLFALIFCLLVLALTWVFTYSSGWGRSPSASSVSACPPSEQGAGSLTSDGPVQNSIQPATEELVQEDRAESFNMPPSTVDAISTGLRHRAAPTSQEREDSPSENCSPLPRLSESLHTTPDSTASSSLETIVLRLKFLNDTERLIRVRPEDNIGCLKRSFFPDQEQQVRLIYQGQLLRDDAQTISSLHLINNSVLHCHISQYAAPQAPAGTTATDQVHAYLNVGNLMMPLFFLMLALLWYCQVEHHQYFTPSATICLISITVAFSFMVFSVYRS